MTKPLISVIIPTFNRAAVLLRAIDSVLKQQYKNFELIIIDDGSTDGTEILLKTFIENGVLKYFRQENSGVSSARNCGAKMAKGEWLSFLDSDDEWLPHKLQVQIDFLKTNPNFSIVYGQEIWIRNGKRVNPRLIHQKFGGWIFDKCVLQCLIAPSSVLLQKNLFIQMGGFDLDYIVCEDYDLWLKISSLYEVGFISSPIMIKHGGHIDQLSTKYVAMDMWRLRSLKRILTIRSLSFSNREIVLGTIKQKASILLLGYEKHGNSAGVNEVQTILDELLKLE